MTSRKGLDPKDPGQVASYVRCQADLTGKGKRGSSGQGSGEGKQELLEDQAGESRQLRHGAQNQKALATALSEPLRELSKAPQLSRPLGSPKSPPLTSTDSTADPP